MNDPIQAQYEAYPYPPRDPEDERRRLIVTMLDGLDAINHYIFGGCRSYRVPIRILDAGSGTGDALIYLAQQLRERQTPAEIVYLDISVSSRKIAEARAHVRSFKNIQFETGSVLDLEPSTLGTFDFIECSGVLHHLEDPLAALRGLVQCLKPAGGLGLMLYGELGRTGIYPVQQMLRAIAPESLAPSERVRLARKLTADLPKLNWLNCNPTIDDHRMSDAYLFDLLLNSRDQAYSVENLSVLMEQAELRIVSFVPPAYYRPSTYLRDPELLDRAAALPPLEQAAFAEKLRGTLNKHALYAVKKENPVTPLDPLDLSVIPLLQRFPEIPYSDAGAVILHLDGPYFQGVADLAPDTAKILRMVDGSRPFDEIRSELNMGVDEIREAILDCYEFLNGYDFMYLRRGI